MKAVWFARDRGGAALTDALWVAAFALISFALAAKLQLFERFSRAVLSYEPWELDEMLFALHALALALVWYGWRRWREARAAQADATALLARNRELAQQLIGVQESERRAIARELHDELAQCCHAIRVEAAWLGAASAPDTQAVHACAGRIASGAQELVERVRSLLRRLRPADLDALGLAPAASALCEGWQRKTGVACELRLEGSLDDLGDAQDVALYRVLQEALSNVARHAQASRVSVLLAHEAQHVRLAVHDDGRGIDPRAESVQGGLGLLGARERAAMLGGTLVTRSARGSGTQLEMVLPLNAAPAAESAA